MNIFVLGASGYIGNAVAKALARNGHCVTGLTRKQEAAVELQRSEIRPILGNTDEPSCLSSAIQAADIVVHCAYDDSGNKSEKAERFVTALLEMNPKKTIYTSGVWVYGNRTETVDETSPLAPLDLVKWRPPVEQKILQSGGVVIRPGIVYGYGKGLMAMLFKAAQQKKLEIPGDGENFWPLVHVEDLANLFVLAVEKQLKATLLNGMEASSVKLGEVAQAIAKLEQTEVIYLPLASALQVFGPFSEGLAANQRHVLNVRALRLGWNPKHTDFLARIPHYWRTWMAS